MNVLVTGGAGYLGSWVVSQLLARGHRVRVIDKEAPPAPLRLLDPESVDVVRGDICRIIDDEQFLESLLADIDCTVHLAALSSERAVMDEPEVARRVNLVATSVLARRCKSHRVRLIFSSTSAVYGVVSCVAGEHTRPKPVSAYAASKLEAERSILQLKDENWSPVVLRSGTLFGLSPRMRFDLVINRLCRDSIRDSEIRIMGGGSHWRPFLHVSDCARAFAHFAESPQAQHAIYNVADVNLRIVDLVPYILDSSPGTAIVYPEKPAGDASSYRVSTRRLREQGFLVRMNLPEGVRQLARAIRAGELEH